MRAPFAFPGNRADDCRISAMNACATILLSAVVLSVPAMSGAWPARADDQAVPAIRIEVTDARFRLVKPDGSVLQGANLVGLIMHLRNADGEPIDIRIDSVTLPASAPDAEIELYGLSRRDAGRAWVPLCKPGADGRALGFPLPGATPADEEMPASGGTFSITCTAGARGKCVMLGYRPWAVAASGESLQPYFAACVGMMRADYCGDGRSYTRPGVKVDMWDRAGVQAPQTSLSFEAAWGSDGAVCMRRTRVAGIATTAEIANACPRLADHIEDCEVWSQSSAAGALMWNRSPGGD
jgi:hypothetical protein